MARILVMDDSAFMRTLLRGALEAAGHEVEDFLPMSALEVLKKTKEWKPDLVLTDYHMPLIKGDEVARMAQRGCPDARILVLTATRDPDVEARLRRSGASLVLFKPMAAPEVLRHAEELLAQ